MAGGRARSRGAAGVVVALVGGAAAVALFVMAVASVQARHRRATEESALQLRNALALYFSRIEIQLASLAAHLSTSDQISVETYARFYRLATRSQAPESWRALAFAPELDASDPTAVARLFAAFEDGHRAAGYPATSPVATDARVRWPLVLVEPPRARDGVFGFDLSVSGPRVAAARKALATGQVAVSTPVALSQDPSKELESVLLVAPVQLRDVAMSRTGLPGRGVVAAGVTPRRLMEDILGRDLDRAAGVTLQTVSSDDTTVEIRWTPTSQVGGAPGTARLYRADPPALRLGDRTFRLRYEATRAMTAEEAIEVLAVFSMAAAAALFAAAYIRRVERQSAIVSRRLAEKEEELRAAEQTAARAQRLEAMGRLVGGVAHDFNNLLTVVLGNLEILKDRPRPEEGRRSVEEAIEAAQRGAELTRRLLAFGRRTQLQPEVLELDAVLRDMERMLRRVLPESIGLHIGSEAGARAKIRVDRSQLENATLNLVLNARDAMPRGGEISVSTSRVVLDARRARALDPELEAGAYAVLTIRDTGHGMDEETLARAFEPFFTTKPVGSGTGLGLASVFGFVKQSGGTVRVESQVGQGTRFALYLPEGPPGEDAAEPSVESGPSAELARARVLLVEDDPGVRRVVEALLRAMGLEVESAPEASSALARMQRGYRPDLLISDVVMPGKLQGLDLLAEARVLAPDLPAVLMSGYAGDGAPDLEAELDAVLLPKPVSRETLTQAIRDALNRTVAD